ncbi:MAG TPA: helix-turn-helix transcriptional regulator [Arthrobacter sp.]
MPTGAKPQPDDFNRAVMDVVNERMGELGFSTADLALTTGIPPSTLSAYLRSVKQPDIRRVRQIAIALSLRMPDLMARAEV